MEDLIFKYVIVGIYLTYVFLIAFFWERIRNDKDLTIGNILDSGKTSDILGMAMLTLFVVLPITTLMTAIFVMLVFIITIELIQMPSWLWVPVILTLIAVGRIVLFERVQKFRNKLES
jgi:hypothetical protein